MAGCGAMIETGWVTPVGEHHHDLNQRAAGLHSLTDATGSVAVLISALLVGATGWLWLDPATALGVGVAVMWSAWWLLTDAWALNLDAVPEGIDLALVEAELLGLPAVLAVDKLHVWGLSTSRAAFTAHLLVDSSFDSSPAPGERGSRAALLNLARERLMAMGIRNTTLQLDQLERSSQPMEHHQP
jgi:cobalt-zinc-cadmium efflux system protein